MRNLILDVYNKTKVILGVFLVLSVFLCGIAGTAVDAWADDPVEMIRFGKIELLDKNGNLIANGSEGEHPVINNINDDFKLHMVWIVDDTKNDFEGFSKGVFYKIKGVELLDLHTDAIDGMCIPMAEGGTIEKREFNPATAENVNGDFAQIRVIGGVPCIQFSEYGLLHGGQITLSCNIHAEKNDADHEGNIEFKFDGAHTIKIHVPSFEPTGDDKPSVAKSNSGFKNYNNNLSKEVEWTIKYDPGFPNWPVGTYPNNIKDFLPSGMEYVTGSAQIKYDNGSFSSITPDTTTTPGTLIFTPDNLVGEKRKVTITYRTVLTDAEYLKIYNDKGQTLFTYENSVNIYKDSEKKQEEPAKSTASTKAPSLIKQYQSYSPVEGENYGLATWRITVNTFGTKPTNLIVTDKIVPKEGDNSSFLSDIGNVKIRTGNNQFTDVTEGVTYTPTDNPTSFSFDLAPWINGTKKPAAVLNSSGLYEITYTTKLSHDAFTASDADKLAKTANEASLEMTNTAGTGTGPVTSGVNIGLGPLNYNLIKKETDGWGDAPGYSAKTYGFKVTVNENKLPETQAVSVYDYLKPYVTSGYRSNESSKDNPDYSIKMFIQSIEVIGAEASNLNVKLYSDRAGTSEITSGITTSSNKVSWTVDKNALNNSPKSFRADIPAGGINAKTVTFKVTVYFMDDEFVIMGPSHIRENNSVELKVGDNTQKVNDIEHGTSLPAFIKKQAVGYDPEKQEIEWRLVFNDKDDAVFAIGEVVIEDNLPAGLTYTNYDETYNSKLYHFNKTQLKNIDPAVDETKQNIKWTVNIADNEDYEIYYKTKVDFDLNAYESENGLEFRNEVKAYRTADPDKKATAEATVKFPKQSVVDKKGEWPDRAYNEFKYSIGINPLKQDIVKGVDKILIKDKLSDNLVLKSLDSVKLYKATVGLKDPITAGDTVTLGEYEYTKVGEPITLQSIDYNVADNLLEIELKPETDLNYTYVLEYDALATAEGEITNTIDISGIKEVKNDNSDNQMTFKAAVHGFSYRKPSLPDKLVTIEINKVDAAGNVIFKLDADENPIEATVSEFVIYGSETGTDKIAGPLKGNQGFVTIPESVFDGRDAIWVEEIKTPDGYKPLGKREEVLISNLTFTEGTNATITIKNYLNDVVPTKENLKVKKIDEATGLYDAALNGTEFELYSDESCTADKKVGGPLKITNAEGIEFTDLTAGEFYYLKETTSAEGYEIPNTPFEVRAGDVLEISVPNRKKNETDLTIKKVDEKGIHVLGARFTIYTDEACTDVAKCVHGNSLENIEVSELGHIVRLPYETYYIKEVHVPAGYIGSEVIKVELTQPAQEERIVNKQKNPPKPPTPPTPPTPDNPGGDTPSQPPQITPKTDANGVIVVPNGTIIHTGQLWWPVWVMGALGAIFVIAGIIMAIVKRKRNYPED